MSVRVIRPGLLTTVQDLGRFGHQQYGVSVGGAMDSISLRIANLLVGNASGSAALEITLAGPVLSFDHDALIAICGADLSPRVDGTPIASWRPVWVRQQSRLEFGPPVRGCRAYLAIAGGFDVPSVLNSQSTYLRANLGGFQGRALQAGDLLKTGPISDWGQAMIAELSALAGNQGRSEAKWFAGADLCELDLTPPVRVLCGGQFDWFTRASQQAFFREVFTVTNQSDRMGYRLKGPPLELVHPRELISEGVTMGSIQVPAGGQSIVLMADRPTTGGYPKIAQVATVDLARLAQARPQDKIRFTPISVDEAQQALRTQDATMQRLTSGLVLMVR
ncbi:biotin-dependent carboxyltransferase family protein [Schlesneria sp.]|uniref:5-oxoprolinase subunit C family protein n=1 Tax=Schlesneria sp. TaxID=2762018 RepID=UPI002EE26B7E